MWVHVDLALCTTQGLCTFEAPEVFSFDDDDRLVFDPTPAPELLPAVERAVRACPVQAITLTEEGD